MLIVGVLKAVGFDAAEVPWPDATVVSLYSVAFSSGWPYPVDGAVALQAPWLSVGGEPTSGDCCLEF